MDTIKARGIRLALSAAVLSLIALVGPCLSDVYLIEYESELYKKLDEYPAWAERTLLEVKEIPYTYICGVTVADLLEFRNTACPLWGLTESHFTHKALSGCTHKRASPNGRHIQYETNEGVYWYVQLYGKQRIRACEKKILPYYFSALAEIPDKEKEIIEQTQTNPLREGSPYSREETITSCVQLIKSLAGNLPPHEATSIGKYHEFIRYWNERAATCKEYVKSRCSTELLLNENAACKEAKELI